MKIVKRIVLKILKWYLYLCLFVFVAQLTSEVGSTSKSSIIYPDDYKGFDWAPKWEDSPSWANIDFLELWGSPAWWAQKDDK
ncbi:MAG: hypothetical protein UR85_C0004G0008 [Candidatus Nomurabacteria bacterium GW2011_GWF2_35_66]|uniref:Uncharacterized protein n=1 Tax=Candidatus Nomurabacteria bacterium GW2011_GWE1_35_16 TaxID=1618761 RepID=A0A0G0BBC5_9BACT|nr:MAG: hypothetical protein UR55_C0002G0007 [Candidatus Nomurabacteria bacterium GW2011_GWF1_34_20]KKP63586.1 MAG: hypothetical protein UR57_C0002G0007 [Candidatus Nomurabacteria bacterium GW2011_GWE2_34_25]KKP66788.1 MAG: hypothetical protein UR64_C0002G0004 [Candidatus Nomurabacteria bacterium GW2011_GWE1_35_16]KKP83414.1 MAG: hypothetical protein UR85_C0004G0008 [Candidatus Nomurabacteria bacterium GW2011_GWF2_35_66]HAE36652.1 hypothetical protein [Candidatus Nomurabacteria bacterium]